MLKSPHSNAPPLSFRLYPNISQVVHFVCEPKTAGRNEYGRGNLKPTFEYIEEATQGAGNVLYIDGDSTDGSAAFARAFGIPTLERMPALEDFFANIRQLAEIMDLPVHVLEGRGDSDYPPLRKGIDVNVAQMEMLRRALKGTLQLAAILMDTDYHSIPGGKKAHRLRPEQVYYPLHLCAAGYLELTARRKRPEPLYAIYTGSGKRNNEPIAALFQTYGVDAVSPLLSDDQKRLALALYTFAGMTTHPLTGDLMVATGGEYNIPLTLEEIMANPGSELNRFGATGQGVEIARVMGLAFAQLQAYGTADIESLLSSGPLVGNVRRGRQERSDEPQPDEKEWWMIGEVLPIAIRIICAYAIHVNKPTTDFTLDDWAKVNRWLARVGDGSRIDSNLQRKAWDKFPMERITPPPTLLLREGIIKV